MSQATWLRGVEARVEERERTELNRGTEGRRMVGASRDAVIERLQELEVRSVLLTAERDTLAYLLRQREREVAELRDAVVKAAFSRCCEGRA